MTNHQTATVMAQKGRRGTTDATLLEAPRARAESEVRNKGRIGRRQHLLRPLRPFLVFTCNARTHTHKAQPGTRVVTVVGQAPK
jgi:hypothetical protein